MPRVRDLIPPRHQVLLCGEVEKTRQERQSFELVYILLNAAVASIASLRKLFPEDCFEYKQPAKVHHVAQRLYEQSIAGGHATNGHHIEFELVLLGQSLKFLSRGRHAGVDKVLDWLDTILKGLLAHSLNAVRFSISADRATNSNVLEFYKFCFQYSEGPENRSKRLAGILMPGRGGVATITTMTKARTGLKRLLEHLYEYNKILPDLPRKRFLMCHLFHETDQMSLKRPDGFHTCMDPDSLVPDDLTCNLARHDLGNIDTVDIRVYVKMACTVINDDVKQSNGSTSSYLIGIKHPNRLLRNFGIEESPVQPTSARLMPFGHEKAIVKPISLIGETDLSDGSSELGVLDVHGELILSQSKTLNEQTKTTEFSLDDCRKRSLVPTQVLTPGKIIQPALLPPRLLEGKVLAMKAKRWELQLKCEQLGTRSGVRVLNCQCGFNYEEGSMLQCDCCDAWQHEHCYGFTIDEFGNEDHYCYQCLLGGTEESRLEDMKELARFRRAIWVLYDQAPQSHAAYQDKLGVDKKTMTQLVNRLKEEGFLIPVKGGRTKLSKPVKTIEQITKKQTCYSNPMTSISHHYKFPDNVVLPISSIWPPSFLQKRVKISGA